MTARGGVIGLAGLSAAVVGALACSSSAKAPTGYERVMTPYFAELSRQCPTRHLERLPPADLRDSLDVFKGALPRDLESQMSVAEAVHCAHGDQGASCANLGDIEVASRVGLTRRFAAKICESFKACRGPSNCDR